MLNLFRTAFVLGVLCSGHGALADTPKPEIKSVSPRAIPAGRATIVRVYGDNLTTKSVSVAKPPVRVRIVELTTPDPNSKPPGKILLTLEVAPSADCPPESADLTLVQADGAKVTATLGVVQNTAREMVVKKPAETFQQAMPVSGSSVAITGTMSGNVPDLFRLDAKAGDSWELFVAAGRIGSQMDPVLRIRDSRHIPLALSVGDKKKDRHLLFRAPADGAYYVELTEAESKGGPGFDYRLTILKRPPLAEAGH